MLLSVEVSHLEEVPQWAVLWFCLLMFSCRCSSVFCIPPLPGGRRKRISHLLSYRHQHLLRPVTIETTRFLSTFSRRKHEKKRSTRGEREYSANRRALAAKGLRGRGGTPYPKTGSNILFRRESREDSEGALKCVELGKQHAAGKFLKKVLAVDWNGRGGGRLGGTRPFLPAANNDRSLWRLW